jgi:hypothetical protein
MRGGKKSMSIFNYILAMWITLAIGIGLIGAAPWLGSRAKGPWHFRSVRSGSYFALNDGNRPIVCQKVSRYYFMALSGPGKGDKVRASGGMSVYDVEEREI